MPNAHNTDEADRPARSNSVEPTQLSDGPAQAAASEAPLTAAATSILPMDAAVFLAVRVRPRNVEYVVLSVSIDRAVIDSRRVANTDYGCAIPADLVGPAMGIRVTVAPLKKQTITLFVHAWSSRADDDPTTKVDERWKQLGQPQTGDGKLEIAADFNAQTGELA